MIITKLQGGLANQIFQWAYGRKLSLKWKTPLYLDTLFYTSSQFGNTKREFSLNKFTNLKYNIMPNERNISLWSNENDKNILTKVQDNFNFKDLNYQQNSHYYLDGYWQSEKYFQDVSDTIRNDLRPSDELLTKLKQTPFIDTNTISLHIRRTDYVTSNGFHPVQSVEYYQKALDIIGDWDYIFVFSDDIKWCRENLKFKNMIFMEGFSDIEDLYLMSLCKNNIIANSSFSWWGAWLNNNPNKKVVAPANWFGPQANLNTSDLIPNIWIKI